MKTTIGNVTYDTEAAQKLAHKATINKDQQLYQSPTGLFFLLELHLRVDGKKLGAGESWIDLRHSNAAPSRLTVSSEIFPLTDREALEWSIKTQIPATLRGYLLESI